MRRLSLLLSLSLCLAGSCFGFLARRGVLRLPLVAVPEAIRAQQKLGPQEALYVSSAAKGLASGDLMVAVEGKRFKSFAEWNDLLRKKSAGKSVDLTIRREGKEQVVTIDFDAKPIEETATFETHLDEVQSNGHAIRVLITKPKTPGRHPVLFWIQGINASTIDFPLAANNYLSNALRPFAEDGFVTVRVEKPGVGDSEGGPAAFVGYDEEVDIYRQALKSLDRYDFVDRSNVFVFGHSMGGCTAPIVCAEAPVRGIISYGTVSNSWLEWQIRSPRIQGPLGGQTLAQVDQDVRLQTAFYHYLLNEKRTIAWIKRNHPELRQTADSQSPDGIMMNPRSIKYMQEANDKNLCDYWAKLGDTRVLALFGENDWISLREDQTQVADAVNAAHPGHGAFQLVPGIDHLFSKCTSMKDSFDRFGKPGTEFNPAMVDAVKAWIASVKR